MREFFGSVKFKIFVVVACVLIGLMLRTSATGGVSTAAQNVVGVILSPFQAASTRVSDAVTGVIGNISSLGSMKTQNDQLKKQITKLQSQMVDYDAIKRENDQLKGLVDIAQESDKRQYAPALVISRDPGQWFSALTIDKGTLNGVQKNDPVMTSEGLVGVVISADPTTAIVSTVLDPSVHVGAIVSRTGDSGVTQGDRSLATKGEFELSYLTKNTNVTAGDIIITNGRGGIYPKNLRVGTVTDLEQDISGNSVNAVCKPMMDMSAVKDVFVITNFSGKGIDSASSASSSAGGK